MIEDDDSFKQNETLKSEPDEKEGKRRPIMLYLLLLWILWTAALSIYFLPKIKNAILESGVIELIEERSDEGEVHNNQRKIQAAYLNSDDFKVYELTTTRRGSDIYHDTIEALISDYPYDALKDGFISLIPSDTELLGLTAYQGVCYVDLSDEILKSSTYKGHTAYEQIEKTLLSYEEID